ncbi:MAG: adenylate/guanylate cyclase domain-containing protein [Polyangiaceae bacterium]
MSPNAILCVDDERIVLESLREQARRRFSGDLQIETAESGEEALEVFQELRAQGTAVPVVISDQIMPGMKGAELLTAVHRLDVRVRCILLTGQASADAVGEAVNNAALYRYISKPWAESDLVMTVREAIRAFEQAIELERKAEALRAAHAASLRFVPREFLELLGHSRVVDVRFGDHVVSDVMVLFADMRGFTEMVEGKTHAQAFELVNEYMGVMDAVIRRRGGFVSNLEGDAVLALFTGPASDALSAGVEAQRALDALNERRAAQGDRPIRIGVGVHRGPLLLGTIGSDDRLQCDVVGDAVNLASRIESLTKVFGTTMLVSGLARDSAVNPGDFDMRFVGRVRAKGSSTPLTLFEVLDALPPARAAARRAQRASFGAGLELFQQGRLADALACFDEVLAATPDDAAARLYRERCEGAREVPPGWDGVIDMLAK